MAWETCGTSSKCSPPLTLTPEKRNYRELNNCLLPTSVECMAQAAQTSPAPAHAASRLSKGSSVFGLFALVFVLDVGSEDSYTLNK